MLNWIISVTKHFSKPFTVLWRYRFGPPYVNLLDPFLFFTADDQLLVPIGVTHISCHYKNTIEGTGERKKEQTNKHEQYAWG